LRRIEHDRRPAMQSEIVCRPACQERQISGPTTLEETFAGWATA
jgi:hypothetical protein